ERAAQGARRMAVSLDNPRDQRLARLRDIRHRSPAQAAAAAPANDASRPLQPPSLSKMPRISSRRAPYRSRSRCSSSTRVPPPSAMKRTSTSVFRFGSCCQSALNSQESTNREWGSHRSTRPQSQVLPSSSRSYQRPPTCGSITASTALAFPILWVANGHQVPILSVNIRQATAGGAFTLTTFRRLFASLLTVGCSVVMVSSPWLLLARPLL